MNIINNLYLRMFSMPSHSRYNMTTQFVKIDSGVKSSLILPLPCTLIKTFIQNKKWIYLANGHILN